jgi:TetR/AcrR family transcriptional regulator, cholesterol catabolism regulator
MPPATPLRRTRKEFGVDGEERWEHLINVAASLFRDKGYDGTSLRDLAGAVGLSKASVYHYIEGKDDLLYEVVKRALDLRSPALEEDDALANAPAEIRLRAFMQRWMALARNDTPLMPVAEDEFRKLSPRRLRSIVARRDRYGSFVKAIIEQGVAEGAFDPSADPSIATNLLFSTMRSIHRWFDPKGAQSYEQIAAWHIALLIRGLKGPLDVVPLDLTSVTLPGPTAFGKRPTLAPRIRRQGMAR